MLCICHSHMKWKPGGFSKCSATTSEDMTSAAKTGTGWKAAAKHRTRRSVAYRAAGTATNICKISCHASSVMS